MKPGDRLTPGPMPWWFKAMTGAGAVYIGWLWFDLLVNWRWVLTWLTGGTAGE